VIMLAFGVKDGHILPCGIEIIWVNASS